MKHLKYILFLIALIIIPKHVYADNCTNEELNKLKVSAISSTINYNHLGDNNYEIIITNLDGSFYVEDINTNQKITKTNDVTTQTLTGYTGGNSYTFNFFGAEGSSCPHVLLRVQHLSVPKFNPYSKREECTTHQDFDLCSKWYPGTITDEQFITKYNEYLADKENQNKPVDNNNKPVEEKTNIWDKVMDYLNNQYVFILAGVAVLSIIGIIIIKIKRR